MSICSLDVCGNRIEERRDTLDSEPRDLRMEKLRLCHGLNSSIPMVCTLVMTFERCFQVQMVLKACETRIQWVPGMDGGE